MVNFQTCLKTTVLCLVALICTVLPASQDQRPSLAIMEPVGNSDITPINKMTARGALEQYIVNSRRYRVVDRTRIDQVMKEHSFVENGLVDTTNLKEIGKMLQADIVCVSELRKEEGAFIALCSLIDVESGEVSASAYEFIESDTAVEIRNAMNRAAITMLNAGNPEINVGNSEVPSLYTGEINTSGGMKLTVTRVTSFNKASEVEKALRGMMGVDNVRIDDYNNRDRIATIEITTKLSAQDMASGIRGLRSPRLEVMEVSSRAIKVSIK